ncbi:MAG: glycosyltransferase family 2 protein [Frankiaceae bacterium]|nr:glycosyltransferase family 2 protein [Frankiaceae bacterium]MBV9871324.1 glycosyltransferase family 2 protein [Frankiaceae bacterium]
MSSAQNAAPTPVSVILPVLNEAKYLRAAVGSILEQDYPGEIEVVLALGPSKDSSNKVAAELAERDPRVSYVHNPTGRTPAGLNLAVAATRYPIVARVDGHSHIPRDYIGNAVELLERTGADNVGGLMSAKGETDLEQAIATAMTSKIGVGNAPFHVGGEEGPADTVYLGVFRRTALDRVGGYDEDFVRAQDWEMNYRIRSTGGTVYFSPKLSVSYRPRSSLSALSQQYFHYGRWRRQVMRAHPGSINFRYLAPPLAVLGVVAGLVFSTFFSLWTLTAPAAYLLLVLGGSAYVGRGLRLRARLLLPVVLVTMHMSWGVGFLSSWRPVQDA